MNDTSVPARPTNQPSLPPSLLFLAALSLYAATAAPGALFGDPSEYQFIPAILGIAHPPGYAFYTLLAKLWQIVVPLGTVPFRTNLLAAAVGAWTVTAVYLAVRELQGDRRAATGGAALLAALSLAVAPDMWQHSIHANAHIVSSALAATHLWLLLRWWRTGNDRWLGGFAATLGLAAAHHPVTLIGVPAYGLFVLAVRPSILRQRRTLLLLAGCLLLGLTPLLYYPLRSPAAPFGPTDMRTWKGFWEHITAQGLRVNLFHFGLADQWNRARVFWSLLRLQFLLPLVLLIPPGLLYLVRRFPRPALLLAVFLGIHLLFTLNTVQDVMAYLLMPFSALAVTVGLGAVALTDLLSRVVTRLCRPPAKPLASVLIVCHLSFLVFPFYQATLDLQRGISLRDFAAAEAWVSTVQQRFDGRGEGAVLLSDWEHLTPLWVHAYTQGEKLDEEDLRLVYISTANPWPDSVWAHIEEGPIYLPDYRPAVRDAGFRLVPEGDLYRVVAPPVVGFTPTQPLDLWADGKIHLLGFDLPTTTVGAGEPLVLTLYQSAPGQLESIYMPYAQLGPVQARWTTDSRLLTDQWLPGETIVERYELPVPFTLPPGEYPLKLGYADLTGGRAELGLSTGGTTVKLASITILPAKPPPAQALEQALVNLDNQMALMGAQARAGWQTRRAPWQEPLIARPGGVLHLTLTWRGLASPRDSLTVFIHLLDGTGRYVAGYDYTPLGGAAPTYLWFPKWLPGQTFTDPYRLALPQDLPTGDYWLEVGMYGMTSLRRLPVVDLAGNLAGDRFVLGAVRIE